MKPVVLDTFCKAGGAGYGYHLAGFDVVGVDIEPQPRYPFEFYQGDAIEFILEHGHKFDLIHASPPCQAYSVTKNLHKNTHPELVEPTREAILATNRPYVIENVPGAPLKNPITLCGTMFDLRVIRHRIFETSPVLWWTPQPCQHIGKVAPVFGGDIKRLGLTGKSRLDDFQYVSIAGNSFIKSDAEIAMGIDWMTGKELAQAIPPAYTEWIGEQMMRFITGPNHLAHRQAERRPQN